jgi:hypothetical protein
VFLYSDVLSGADADGISEVVSPEGGFVSSHLYLLPTGLVAIELCGCLLPDSSRWTDIFLFMLGGT